MSLVLRYPRIGLNPPHEQIKSYGSWLRRHGADPEDEIRFYRGQRPWGFILFARNVGEPQQIPDLVAALRDCVGRPDAPVFIDQEGGRVQRLRPPLAPNYPAGLGARCALAAATTRPGVRAAWLLARLHAFDLCCASASPPIACRCSTCRSKAPATSSARVPTARSPTSVTALGRAAAEGLMAGGVLPVIKHIPGHGRAFADTHLELPAVDTPLARAAARTISRRSSALAHLPMAMTAHVALHRHRPGQPGDDLAAR